MERKHNFDVYYPEDKFEKLYFTIKPIISFKAHIRIKFYGKLEKLPPVNNISTLVSLGKDKYGKETKGLN